MNGICYPVSNTLAELETRGGYMTPNCGAKLKELYDTSTAVNQIITKNYTATMYYAHTAEINVKNGSHTPLGQINLRNQATGEYDPNLSITRSRLSINHTAGTQKALFSLVYFGDHYAEQTKFTEIYR